MNTYIGHSCYVLEFLNDLNTKEISTTLEEELNTLIENFSLENLSDWTLGFRATYTNGRQPLVSKNKLGSYTSDKIKEITVAIPIPTVDKVSWGVQESQHIFKESHFDNLIKNFHTLNTDYRDYKNKTDYIMACIRAGIETSFQQGFTVNKEKIKLKITVANKA